MIIAARTIYWVATGAQHILSEKERKNTEEEMGLDSKRKVLLELSSYNILFGRDGSVYLGRDNRYKLGEDFAEKAKKENQRWRGAEVLLKRKIEIDEFEGKEDEITEEGVVYSLGMIFYEMLMIYYSF